MQDLARAALDLDPGVTLEQVFAPAGLLVESYTGSDQVKTIYLRVDEGWRDTSSHTKRARSRLRGQGQEMTEDLKRARVSGRQTTITFVYTHTGARHMLELAEATQDGQLYTTTSALVYCAFTLEAYLNHLGKLRHADWDEIERNYGKRRKYETFAQAAGLQIDYTRRPYCTLVELFAFRDRMAHGKTVTGNVSVLVDASVPRLPQIMSDSDWQAFATIENTRQAIEDVEVLVRELHAACGHSGDPFERAGGGIYGVTPM